MNKFFTLTPEETKALREYINSSPRSFTTKEIELIADAFKAGVQYQSSVTESKNK